MATKLATPSLIGMQIEPLFMQCFEVRLLPTHPTTHLSIRVQYLIPTALISSIFLSPTHPPTHPNNRRKNLSPRRFARIWWL